MLLKPLTQKKYYLHWLLLLLLCQIKLSSAQQDSTLSYFSLPVKLAYSDLNHIIDRNTVSGILYKDLSLNDNNQDQTMLKVTKTGRLVCVGNDQSLDIGLPIKIWYLRKMGPLHVETEFEMTVNLNSTIDIGSQWNLVSSTKLRSYQITRAPEIKLIGTGIDISYLVKYSLDKSLPNILKLIDEEINKSTLIKERVAEAWSQIQQTYYLDTTNQVWLKIIPVKLFITPIKFYKHELMLQGAMAGHLHIGIGDTLNTTKQPFAKPSIQRKLKEQFSAAIKILLPYDELSRLATTYVKDTLFSISKRKSIGMNSVEMSYHTPEVQVKVDLVGALQGILLLRGLPAYNDSLQELYFENFDYALDSAKKIVQLSNQILQRRIRKLLEKSLHYNLSKPLGIYRASVEKFLAGYPVGALFKLRGKLSSFNLETIKADDHQLTMVLRITGKVGLEAQK